MSKTAEIHEEKTCDLCDEKAEYDAKTVMGAWAYLCGSHFNEIGIGLGEGRGQKLIEK